MLLLRRPHNLHVLSARARSVLQQNSRRAAEIYSSPRQQWWEPRMADFLRSDNPPSPTPSPPPYTRQQGPTRHPVPHTAHHAVFVCPFSTSLRLELLSPNRLPHYLFHTDKGASKLVTFLLALNSLLRPLPPCPDLP